MIGQIFLLLALTAPAYSLYSPSSSVVSLTPNDFESKIKSGGIFLIEFYAPWCGHCKALKDDWEKVASALKGIVTVAAVDADAHRSLGAEYNVKGFPTIKAMTYKNGAIKAVDYKGGRTPKEIVEWAMGQAQRVALGRLGVKSSSSGGGSASGNGGGNPGCGAGAGGGAGAGAGAGGDAFYKGTSVIELTDANFHSQVSDSDDIWFIEFYAPWCGHCKALKPTWLELASDLSGKVKVAAVDCTQNQQTCAEFGVNGYPTIKLFGANKSRPEPYEGGRDTASMSAYALQHWARNQPPPEARELTDNEVFADHCLGNDEKKAAQLCLIAFLPNILDSKAAGRNEFLETMKEVAAGYKERPFAWFWAEGGAQPALESNVGVGGYGYPALVAVSPSKQKYASMRSAFSKSSVREFLDNVRTGRERVVELEGELAKMEQRDPWDGSDGSEVIEEEFSLEDLGLGGGNADKDEL